MYGACDSRWAFSARRITYVIDPAGRIAKAYLKVNFSSHAEEVLRDLGTVGTAGG